MVITRNIDGREVDIILTQYEIHMIIEESDKDSAYNDLDFFLENNDDMIVLSDVQKEKIINKYLECRSESNDEWYDLLENAYYDVTSVEHSYCESA